VLRTSTLRCALHWLCRSPGDAEDIVRTYSARFAVSTACASDAGLAPTIVRNCHATALKQQQQRRASAVAGRGGWDGPAMIASTAA
jgi:hypothetical protein